MCLRGLIGLLVPKFKCLSEVVTGVTIIPYMEVFTHTLTYAISTLPSNS